MKLSVAIVTYNQEKYIKQCLDGIVMQHVDFDYEIIIGDDSSGDNTRTICEEYAKIYPQIKVLPKQNRMGIGQNWMRVLQACSGDYFAFCEGDDYWTNKNKLSIQVAFLDEHPQCSMCYTDCDIYYEDTNKYQKNILKKGLAYIDDVNPLKAKGYQSNVTWVFRRNVIEELDFNKFSIDSTSILFFEMYLHGSVHGLDISTGVWRRHSGSETASDNSSEKKYQYEREAFLIRYKYMPVFYKTQDEQDEYMIENIAIYEKSIENNDEEITDLIESYFNNPKEIKQLVLHCLNVEQENNIIRKSLRYQIGNVILFPWVTIRNLLKKAEF